MKATLHNLKGETVGTIELPDPVFGAPWRPSLVQQVLVAEQANARHPWAHAKGRGEVRGGGRKPWRQKGTGRARHGSIRSPLWRGGGKAHGPSKKRDYSQKVNRKMRRVAIVSVLAKKFNDRHVMFFDSLDVPSAKTKTLAQALRTTLGIPQRKKNFDCLLLVNFEAENLFRAARNLPSVTVARAPAISLYDLLRRGRILIDARALPVLERYFAPRP